MSEEQKPVESGGEMPSRERHGQGEKDEKERREEQEKHSEKEEKDQGWQRDPLGGLLLAFFLILAGVILLAESLGYITWDQFGGLWNLFFIAAGLFLLIEVVLRLLLPACRRPILGQLIGGIVLLVMGVGGMIGFEFTWPVALIGLGLVILLGGLLGGRF